MRWPWKEWGADVVIAGHDHDYERLFEEGMLYFVNGAGAGPRSIGNPIPGSQVLDNKDSGAMLIQSNSIAMTFQFQHRNGEVVDTYTLPANS
jgi:tartrate-resistant acid phosphatase type 5